MKVTVVVRIETDDDAPTVAHEVFTLERGPLALATLGSTSKRQRTSWPACRTR